MKSLNELIIWHTCFEVANFIQYLVEELILKFSFQQNRIVLKIQYFLSQMFWKFQHFKKEYDLCQSCQGTMVFEMYVLQTIQWSKEYYGTLGKIYK
jgi:hypothetical protein